MDLLKNIGYDLDLNNFVEKETYNNSFVYVSKSSTKKIIPSFLIEKNMNDEEMSILLDGLHLVGDYLEKTILKPNNILLPLSRTQFINFLK